MIVLSGNFDRYRVTVRCEATSTGCGKKGWIAHMNSESKGMNICLNFFDTIIDKKESPYTGTAIASYAAKDLRYMQRSKSAIILHEISHTWYAMGRAEKADGYGPLFNLCCVSRAGS